jgi:hypothetical protein
LGQGGAPPGRALPAVWGGLGDLRLMVKARSSRMADSMRPTTFLLSPSSRQRSTSTLSHSDPARCVQCTWKAEHLHPQLSKENKVV